MGKWNIYYTYSNKNLFGADKISNLILSTNLSKMCDTKDEEYSLESSDTSIMFNIYYTYIIYWYFIVCDHHLAVVVVL